MAERLRHWTLKHDIVVRVPPFAQSSVPKVPGQDLYPKCAPVHSAVNENLAIHRERYTDHPWLVACVWLVCSVEELRRCWCVQVFWGNNMYGDFDNCMVVSCAISSNKLLLL